MRVRVDDPLAPREALDVELRFFVLARQARHPEVELEIVA